MSIFTKFFLNRRVETDQIETLEARIEGLTRSIKALDDSVAKLSTNISTLGTPKKATAPKLTGLRLAIVGVRGHGRKHVTAFLKLADCHISHICDVDKKVGKAVIEEVFAAKGYRPKYFQDIREMLKDEELDCVAIATPHHWHTLMTIWCLQAGKHVYVEKPITHTFSEGPHIMAAAKKYGKVVQSGTQLRSNTSLAAAGEYMRSGKLGKIIGVHCLIHKNRPQLPLKNDNKVPTTVDYDLWCGPAEKSDLTRSKFHYHWHWFWAFGNGALGNNGVHRIDAARIALDLKGYGDLALSYGGRYGPQDTGETPNTHISVHKFGDVWVLQDVMGLNPKPFRGMENAVLFYGTEGTVIYKSGYAELFDENDKSIMRFEGKQLNHYQNFLTAVKKKTPEVLRGDLHEGIISSNICHFGNISYRLGKEASDEEIAAKMESIGAPDFIKDRLAAIRGNLQDNDVDKQLILGETLMMRDDEVNPFINNACATELLKAHYREPYVLPDLTKV